MTIDLEEARTVAEAALRAEGGRGTVIARGLRGGWRFWTPEVDGTVGAAHAVVSSRSGGVRIVPAGTPDALLEARLER